MSDREWMSKTHAVKCWPEYFEPILAGRKTFEVRLNDRDYREGDILVLREWSPETKAYTKREVLTQVGFVLPLDDRGAEGHVAFSISNLTTRRLR